MDIEATAEPAFSPCPEEEMTRRRPLSLAWGIASLLAGVAATSALLSPMLWSVAGCGLVVNVLAVLYLVRHTGSAVGERLAAVGLALTVAVVAAAPTHELLHQRNVGWQAQDVGSQWLNFLLHNEPYFAFESLQPVEFRRKLDAELAKQYEEKGDKSFAYREFRTAPLVRTLGALGGAAQVNHYQTESIESTRSGAEIVNDVYAITYVLRGQKTSFFVRLELERREDHTSPRGLWRVKKYEGGITPRTPPPD